MRIVEIREVTVPLGAAMRNADIRFDTMTASALAVITDARRDGEPVVGFGFDSFGRYGHGGLARERFIPRILAAAPQDYADTATGGIDPLKISAIAMRNEKLGGHGERAGAIGLINSACWDAAAKFVGKPLWRVLADRFNGGAALERVPVYASGGHYRDGDELPALRAELAAYRDLGYRHFKIKVGGAPLARDLARIEAALAVVGTGSALAIDANTGFDLPAALRFVSAIAPYKLAWLEEPLDPLDYAAHRALSQATAVPLATGENIFSAADARNMLRHGGLDPERDYLQIDIALAYGVPEYLKALAFAAAEGWGRGRFLPHAGHIFSFHVVAGLGLGRHEAAPDAAALFGGYPAGVAVEDGAVRPWDMPGVGFEAKANLHAIFRNLANKE